MRKTCIIFVSIIGLMAPGCEETDVGMAVDAGIEAFRAATLDDEDVKKLSMQLSRQYDRNHTVAHHENPYAIRLRRLTAQHRDRYGRKFDFKVYLSPKVNAFAMADGSVRVYSGLMDILDDTELLFVLGHEMGHVVEDHVKEKIRLAYASSAFRKAIASQVSEAGEIARSVLGALAENLLNAQFSQREERQADDFGVAFLKEQGHSSQPAISALEKLSSKGDGYSFLSSHPAPIARAERLREKALSNSPGERPSFLQNVIAWLLNLWPFGKDQNASIQGFCSPIELPGKHA